MNKEEINVQMNDSIVVGNKVAIHFSAHPSNAWLADDLWMVALRARKGIVHLWNRSSKHGNPDFFISACNILARKENYRVATDAEKNSGRCAECAKRAAANAEITGSALLRSPG